MDQGKENRIGDEPSPHVEQAPESRGTPRKEPKPNDGLENTLGQPRRRSLAWYAAWATIISVPAGLLTAVAISLFTGPSEVSVFAGGPRKPQLERVDLIARNGLPPHKPTLELIVRNGGGGRSVISRARIEVLRVYPMPLCFTQGSLGVSERYGVQLPPDALPGEIIEVPLHQQVGGGAADRFTIRLGLDPDRVVGEGPVAENLGAQGEKGRLSGVYVFEIAVALLHDGSEAPLGMGTALISVPELPWTSQSLLKKGEFEQLVETFLVAPESRREVWSQPLPCWQENGRNAQLARRSTATRSPQLEEVLASAIVPTLSEIEG